MGIGPRIISLYRRLKAEGEEAFTDGNSVCDLGSQDLQPGKDKLQWTNAAVLVKELKLRYVCIDLNGKYGALQLDLNTCTAQDVGRRFNVVTNFGTSEHVFNQANVFKLMHDLCLTGGLMLHCSPSIPSREDCFYHYNIGLYKDLAEANDYENQLESFMDNGNNSVLAIFRRRSTDQFNFPQQKRYQ